MSPCLTIWVPALKNSDLSKPETSCRASFPTTFSFSLFIKNWMISSCFLMLYPTVICWYTFRSNTHTLPGVSALIVASLFALYSRASSPKTLTSLNSLTTLFLIRIWYVPFAEMYMCEPFSPCLTTISLADMSLLYIALTTSSSLLPEIILFKKSFRSIASLINASSLKIIVMWIDSFHFIFKDLMLLTRN